MFYLYMIRLSVSKVKLDKHQKWDLASHQKLRNRRHGFYRSPDRQGGSLAGVAIRPWANRMRIQLRWTMQHLLWRANRIFSGVSVQMVSKSATSRRFEFAEMSRLKFGIGWEQGFCLSCEVARTSRSASSSQSLSMDTWKEDSKLTSSSYSMISV